MSSSDRPRIATSEPNTSSMARRSGISATQGAHHVAQRLSTRTFAFAGKAFATAAGSFTARTSAPKSGSATLRNEAANSPYFRIGAIHLHFDRAVLLVLL